MPFPAAPNNGDLHVEGNRQFVYVAALPGWELTGLPAGHRSWNNLRLTDLALPVDPEDATNKQYVDQLATGAQQLIGTMDATTGQCLFDPASGIPNGLLPAATAVAANDYVIIAVAGTPPAGPPETRIPLEIGDWLIDSGTTWVHLQVGGATQTGATTSLNPPVFGETNVQDALEQAELEVDAKVERAGDTMLGPFFLFRDPLTDPEAATKAYVDASILAGPFVELAGDVMTGPLEIQAQPFGFSRIALTVANAASRASVQFNTGGVANWDFHMPGFGPNTNSLVLGRHNITTGILVENPLIVSNPGGGAPGASVFSFTGTVMLDRPPTQNLQAATKLYVDTLVTAAQQLIGAMNAATGQVRYTANSGFPDGVLVPAATAGQNRYVIVETPGTVPVGPAEIVGLTAALGDWFITDGNQWILLRVGSQGGLASGVALIPPAFGANNVQDALTQAETEVDQKVIRTGDTMTGSLLVRTNPANGFVRLDAGANAGTPGNIGFTTGENTRRGYIGWMTNTNRLSIQAENGWSWQFGQAVFGQTPTDNAHLATKSYVDSNLGDLTATNGGAVLTAGQWYLLCMMSYEHSVDLSFSANATNSAQSCNVMVNFYNTGGGGVAGFNVGAHAINGNKVFNRLEVTSSPAYAIRARAAISGTFRLGRTAIQLSTGTPAGGTLGQAVSGGTVYGGIDI